MSWEPPSDDPSPAPDPAPGSTGSGPGPETDLAPMLRRRGAPLIDALDRHAPGSREHAEASGSYAFAAAVELGQGRARSELIREATKLHEVGRVYVPTAVLAKPPQELSAEERAQLDRHHEAAYRLAHGAGLPDEVCGWILRVRERFDGAGPESLAGEAIPIESRIARAACVCDAALSDPTLTSPDAGLGERPRWAVAHLRGLSGRELDPRVVGAFAAVLERATATET